MLGAWLVFLGAIALTLLYVAIIHRWLKRSEEQSRRPTEADPSSDAAAVNEKHADSPKG
jgi:hypothetical protein